MVHLGQSHLEQHMAQALVPVEQRTVEFYEDELIAVRGDDGQVYVAIC